MADAGRRSTSGRPPDVPWSTVAVGPVPIAIAEPPQVLGWVAERVATATGCTVLNHVPADPTVRARREPALAAALGRAVNVADGMGTVWAARRLSGTDRPRQRTYGPDFMLDVLAHGLAHGWRHAFVGGTDEVLPRLLANLEHDFDGLAIAGAHAPPFRDVSPEGVEEDLAAVGADADILWVGLGTPKQQLWADLARRHEPARLIVTVGAAFDFHAGQVSQAPDWMQDHGLEWLYRLAQEPARLAGRYLVGNTRHVFGVMGDLRRQRRGRTHS